MAAGLRDEHRQLQAEPLQVGLLTVTPGQLHALGEDLDGDVDAEPDDGDPAWEQ